MNHHHDIIFNNKSPSSHQFYGLYSNRPQLLTNQRVSNHSVIIEFTNYIPAEVWWIQDLIESPGYDIPLVQMQLEKQLKHLFVPDNYKYLTKKPAFPLRILQQLTFLESSQVKRTHQYSSFEIIIGKLNPLVVVDLRFIFAILHA